MAKQIEIVEYSEMYKEKWDLFVTEESANGTFLQTRRFLDYHPADRFIDNSLIFLSGSNIIAVLPAHIKTDEVKYLFSHHGSTFGGLIIGQKFCKITYLDIIFEKLNTYLQEKHIDGITLKQTGGLYQKNSSELIDYYLFINGFSCSQELGYYIDYNQYNEDVIMNFTASKRRDYRYSLKNNFVFCELRSDEELVEFYDVLCDNYKKFGKSPVHTLEELLDFKNFRLSHNVEFYGVQFKGELIAVSMIFTFEKKVFHTQYLAVRQEKNDIYVNEFLYTNLIELAKNRGFQTLSFGTATLESGKILNRPLAQFKEGFGTKEYTNRIYSKILTRRDI